MRMDTSGDILLMLIIFPRNSVLDIHKKQPSEKK